MFSSVLSEKDVFSTVRFPSFLFIGWENGRKETPVRGEVLKRTPQVAETPIYLCTFPVGYRICIYNMYCPSGVPYMYLLYVQSQWGTVYVSMYCPSGVPYMYVSTVCTVPVGTVYVSMYCPSGVPYMYLLVCTFPVGYRICIYSMYCPSGVPYMYLLYVQSQWGTVYICIYVLSQWGTVYVSMYCPSGVP
jgi:hypothetical protein